MILEKMISQKCHEKEGLVRFISSLTEHDESEFDFDVARQNNDSSKLQIYRADFHYNLHAYFNPEKEQKLDK